MIKVTLTPQTQPITYIFEKDSILIGKISCPDIVPDLIISHPSEKSIFVKIELIEEKFIAYNLAEDPFITINKFPFNKKNLKSGDLLQIGTIDIYFEGLVLQNAEDRTPPDEDAFLVDLLSKKMEVKYKITTDHLCPSNNALPLDLEEAMFGLEELLKKKEIIKNVTEFTDLPPSIESTFLFESPFSPEPLLSNQNPHLIPGGNFLSDEELETLFSELDALDEIPHVFPGNNSEDQNADTKLHSEPTNVSILPQFSPSIENLKRISTYLEASSTPTRISDEITTAETPAPASKIAEPELAKEQYTDKESENESLNLELKKEIAAEGESPHLHEPQKTLFRSKSMKDDDSPEIDESTSARKEKIPYGEKTISISWKMFFSAVGAILLLALIVSSSLYFAISGRNEEEEIKAAQAVADVAMALNSALINHAQPQNHNWSDPNFLKHTLAAVLARPYQPLLNLDSHGHFKNTSYILRIYTGDDLNHFLIIAQPRPNLLQWIMPKAAITVDSSFMELRKITDLKTLNRLLINAKLDNSNSTDVANLVKLGELIPLTSLKKNHPHAGFDLPKALGFVRPGAENLIYNAIRYYPLGESLMKKAIAIYDNEENGHDLIPLIDEISLFTRFPHIILYSSEGMNMAQRGNKALATFFPHYKFLYAYLQFNPQNFTHRSTLLIDDNEDRVVAIASIEEQEPLEQVELEGDVHVDKQHPLYYKLIALHNESEQALKPISDKIINENINPKWDSPRKLAALQINYEMLSQKMHEIAMRAIIDLQQENSFMPFSQFMNYIKATKTESHLEKNLQMHLQNGAQLSPHALSIKDNILKIKESASIRELNTALTKTSQLLTLETTPDPAQIIAFQNEIHSNVIHKLDALLLYPENPLPPVSPDDRDSLSHILKTAWVTEEGEFEYYLHEFDLLYSSKL
ncbi:MAG: hypothetical protein H0W50_03945 [Parachlamydiaceae bacterium]|nr:hypothetical protein [Parachlamydiaceae bacterium]